MTADNPPSLRTIFLSALISGAVISSLLTLAFTSYRTRAEAETRSRHDWKEGAVRELLGPMILQFDRTKRAFNRYNQRNIYLEAKVLKVGNETIRDLLLGKGHLIPTDLLEDAAKLVEHYDVWLELFERQRGGTEPDLHSEFVFAGPEGYPFPSDAEERFRNRYHALWQELYGAK